MAIRCCIGFKYIIFDFVEFIYNEVEDFMVIELSRCSRIDYLIFCVEWNVIEEVDVMLIVQGMYEVGFCVISSYLVNYIFVYVLFVQFFWCGFLQEFICEGDLEEYLIVYCVYKLIGIVLFLGNQVGQFVIVLCNNGFICREFL